MGAASKTMRATVSIWCAAHESTLGLIRTVAVIELFIAAAMIGLVLGGLL